MCGLVSISLSLCNNGGHRRHHVIFDAGEFAVEFSTQKIQLVPEGNFRDTFQLEESVGECLRLLEGSASATTRGAENHLREIRPSSELTGGPSRMCCQRYR